MSTVPPRSPAPLRGLVRAVLGALGALALGACADDPAPAAPVPLVEVVTNRLDGEPPDHDLAIRRVEAGRLGPPIALTPVPGRPRVYEARGASDGSYLLSLPEGWGALNVVSPPRVSAGAHPAKMNAGRAHTVYLTSKTLDRTLGEAWGARRVLADGSLGPPLPLKVEVDGNGWVLLRFRPEDWAGKVLIQGRFDDRTLAEQIQTTLKEQGLPILRQLDPEPAGPLRVVVVGVPPGVERWVHVAVLGLPIDDAQQRPVREGVAEFPSVATSKEGLELRVGDGDDAPTYRIASADWARDGEVRVRDVAPAPRASARLTVPDPSALVRVQVRAEGEDSYGWVPARVEGDTVAVTVGPGSWRVLVQTRAGFAAGTLRAKGDGTLEAQELGPVEPAARVAGSVKGGAGLARLHWRRVEGERQVLGHGFVVGAGQAGAFEVTLPPGKYLLEIHGPEGARSTPRSYDLTPGLRVNETLDMPPTPPR